MCHQAFLKIPPVDQTSWHHRFLPSANPAASVPLNSALSHKWYVPALQPSNLVHRNLCVRFWQPESLLWLETTKGATCAWITRDEITDLFDPWVRRQRENQGCSVSKLVSRWKTDQRWDWLGVKEYLLQYWIDKTFLMACKIWLLFAATIAYWILSRPGSDSATIRNSWLHFKGKQITSQ